MRIHRRRADAAVREPSRGQSLVEFALVIPIFITLVVAICEFAFMFTTYLSASFTSRDAVQVAAEMGDSPCADEVILARIEQDLMGPANASKIKTVEIFWSDGTGNVKGGAVNTWVRSLSATSSCTLPNGTGVSVPYSKGTPFSYPLDSRCNILLAVGCASGHDGLDTIGVTITYQYTWVTPLPGLVGLSGSGMEIVQTNVMRMEPIK
jgi:Flp pilus assembly protein TadG